MAETRRASAIATLGFLALVAMPGVAAAADPTVTIEGPTFVPTDVTTTVGATVTWINKDVVAHDAADNYGKWKTPTLMPNEQASITFDTPGTFGYRCSLHPSMRGNVTVLDEAPSTDTLPIEPADDGAALAILAPLVAGLAGLAGLTVAARRFRQPGVSR